MPAWAAIRLRELASYLASRMTDVAIELKLKHIPEAEQRAARGRARRRQAFYDRFGHWAREVQLVRARCWGSARSILTGRGIRRCPSNSDIWFRPVRAGGDPEDAFGLVEGSAAPFPRNRGSWPIDGGS